MAETGVLLDGFTRVHDSLHRTLADLTETELTREPSSWKRWPR